ncbi:MAG TPA: alkaline phosphatase PhoX, partial [Asanoa sp.]|nr:alkaline phosphatase PhoX [Asanoa sp.]
MTCLYRCGNACDHPVPNPSGNTYFGDLVAGEVSRRGVMRAGGVTPWGTILSGEENFNQYFVGAETSAGDAKTRFNRYGVDTVNRY